MFIHILTGFCDLHLFSQADDNSVEETQLPPIRFPKSQVHTNSSNHVCF